MLALFCDWVGWISIHFSVAIVGRFLQITGIEVATMHSSCRYHNKNGGRFVIAVSFFRNGHNVGVIIFTKLTGRSQKI